MQSFKINVMLATTIVLWASAFVGIRIGLTHYTPGALALLRFIVASVCMFLIYPQNANQIKIPLKDRVFLLVLGMIGIGIYNICLNYGELTVSAGAASFVIGLMPMLTFMFSVLFLKEKPCQTMYVGIGISLSGLFYMMMSEQSQASPPYGMLLVFLSAVAGALFTVTLKRFLRCYSPVKVAAWGMWGGTLFLMMYSFDLGVEIQKAPWSITLAGVYMGIFPAAIAYMAWSYVLNYMPASKAALYLYTLPIVSTALGFALLHEKPSLHSFVGGMVALCGALVTVYLKPLKATSEGSRFSTE